MTAKKEKTIQSVPIEIEFTDGYEQRFTKEVLKIYENMKKKEAMEANKKDKTA